MSKNKQHLSINVPILARVEGEGALELEIKNQNIEILKLKIYEPPRLFEKFLEGRSYQEVIDLVARICGICPVAYQMSATHAIEQCFDIQPSQWVRAMRRLFYCGEWLESHSLHIHFLALPDFLGFHSAPDLATVHPEIVKRGMRLQAYGNELVALFGGRSVHPIGACVGGFYKAPPLHAISIVLEKAKNLIQDCEDLIAWLSTLTLPDNTHDFICVSLYHPTEYPFNEGRIVSDHGLNIPIEAFETYFKEFQVPYSNALHCTLQGEPYLVGPLARVNNCFGQLPTAIHLLLQRLKLTFPSKNMCQSILARAIEIYFCVLESIRLLAQYQLPVQAHPAITPKAGIGIGCTEAPRGLLWQCYHLDQHGDVTTARIVPPTSQNQARIEADLKRSLQHYGLTKPEQQIRAYAEMIIRNYDPCISCSTHFLNLTIQHT